MKELDLAFQKYQKKLEKIRNSQDYKKLNDEVETCSKKAHKHLQTAIKVFDMKRDEIMQGGGDNASKEKKIEKVYDYMISKLFSPEEAKMFKSMRGKVVYLLD